MLDRQPNHRPSNNPDGYSYEDPEFDGAYDCHASTEWLSDRFGGIGIDPNPDCVQSLKDQAKALGRSLSDTDAEIAASAIEEGLTLITRDQQLYRFMQEAGSAVELF
jgi:hypothetical protein